MEEQWCNSNQAADEEESEEGKRRAKWRRQRERIVTEILSTEQTYQTHINLVLTAFEEPLRAQGLIPDYVIVTIFSNIRQIISVNKELNVHLQHMPIGKAFLKMGPFLKLYSTYANNHERALATLMEWDQKSSEFSAFRRRQEECGEMHGLKLNALLITPVQRIPRYKLLLQDLLEHTERDHSDYSSIEEACRQIGAVAAHINNHIKQQDNSIRMLAIQRSLVGPLAPRLITPGRIFIKDGPLKKVSKKGGRVNERMFYLFSDILVYAKPRLHLDSGPHSAGTYQCCCILPLQHCRVSRVLGKPQGDAQATLFTIQCKEESLLLFSDQKTVDSWINALNKAVGELVENRQSLRKESSAKVPVRKGALLKYRKQQERDDPLNARNPMAKRRKEKDVNSPLNTSSHTSSPRSLSVWDRARENMRKSLKSRKRRKQGSQHTPQPTEEMNATVALEQSSVWKTDNDTTMFDSNSPTISGPEGFSLDTPAAVKDKQHALPTASQPEPTPFIKHLLPLSSNPMSPCTPINTSTTSRVSVLANQKTSTPVQALTATSTPVSQSTPQTVQNSTDTHFHDNNEHFSPDSCEQNMEMRQNKQYDQSTSNLFKTHILERSKISLCTDKQSTKKTFSGIDRKVTYLSSKETNSPAKLPISSSAQAYYISGCTVSSSSTDDMDESDSGVEEMPPQSCEYSSTQESNQYSKYPANTQANLQLNSTAPFSYDPVNSNCAISETFQNNGPLSQTKRGPLVKHSTLDENQVKSLDEHFLFNADISGFPDHQPTLGRSSTLSSIASAQSLNSSERSATPSTLAPSEPNSQTSSTITLLEHSRTLLEYSRTSSRVAGSEASDTPCSVSEGCSSLSTSIGELDEISLREISRQYSMVLDSQELDGDDADDEEPFTVMDTEPTSHRPAMTQKYSALSIRDYDREPGASRHRPDDLCRPPLRHQGADDTRGMFSIKETRDRGNEIDESVFAVTSHSSETSYARESAVPRRKKSRLDSSSSNDLADKKWSTKEHKENQDPATPAFNWSDALVAASKPALLFQSPKTPAYTNNCCLQ